MSVAAIFQTWTAAEIATHCRGKISGDGDVRAAGIANDGRRVQPGQLFAALEAERDGHHFIDQARANGARVLLVARDRRPEPKAGEAVIAVADTYAALIDIGRALWRAHSAARPDRLAIGLTGSNGKTTTKDLIGQLLRDVYDDAVLVTRGNLNSHIGVPMMLAELSTAHRFVVLEMGASRPGDIAQLVAMAPVDRAVVTSIAPAHLEGLGDVASVRTEKGRIFRGHPPADVAVVPASELGTGLLPADTAAAVRAVGAEEASDLRLMRYEPGEPGWAIFVVGPRISERPMSLRLFFALPGKHNALNIATALATVWDLLPEDERLKTIWRVVGGARSTAGRLAWLRGVGGVSILDDTYNANPESVRAALSVLSQRTGRRWAILGDMAELGEAAPAHHRQAGEAAAEAGCERVWAVGQWSADVLEGAKSQGVKDLAAFPDAASCAAAAVPEVGEDDVILVKGSRSVGLERVVQALRAEGDEVEEPD